MPKKILFTDTETTGVDEKDQDGYTLLAHEVHSIIELSGIIDIDGKMVDKFQLYARPKEGDPVSAEALNKNGRTKEEIASFPPQVEMYKRFIEILGKWVDPMDKEDKLWFVAFGPGRGAGFDNEFLRSLFADQGDVYFGSWFWVPYIDIMQLAGIVLMESGGRELMPNMKLASLAYQLGIQTKEENFHDGLYDSRIMRMIYYKLMS